MSAIGIRGKMIDIHTHILPNMDDGANSVDTSKQLLLMEDEIAKLKQKMCECTIKKQEILDKYLK